MLGGNLYFASKRLGNKGGTKKGAQPDRKMNTRERGTVNLLKLKHHLNTFNSNMLLLPIFILLLPLLLAGTSSSDGSSRNAQYEQAISKGETALAELLKTHPDVVASNANTDVNGILENQYRFNFPPTNDYVISILINPCGANGTYGREDDVALGYDCCMERFGQGEYGYRLGSKDRFSNGFSNGIPMDPDEPLHNIDLVDELGNSLDYSHSRRAGDVIYIDESCKGLRQPHTACIADRFAAARSKMNPPCWDNNSTVDSTLDCHVPTGKRQRHCMQVSYSLNAFIPICGGDFEESDTCGSFLEVHGPSTPYDNEAAMLSQAKIMTPESNGMYTTTLSLAYKDDPSRILCSYEYNDIQEGSMVRVKSPISCCCPPWLSPLRDSNKGAFFCPKRKYGKDGGPFASDYKTLEEQYADHEFQQSFPHCPALDGDDILMCTQERVFAEDLPKNHSGRYFVRPCEPLVEADDGGGFSSADVSGLYPGVCPIDTRFTGCGMTLSSGLCHGKDHHYVIDEIGKVTSIPNKTNSNYGVTFNDGRSVYWFKKDELAFLKPESNYEVWFVVRNRFEKIVKKRKPFRVIWPRCTYDSVNDRYFPYAKLDGEGNPIPAL
jgi:hypothetical protein